MNKPTDAKKAGGREENHALEAEIATRLELALGAGREAAEITLRYYRRDNYQVEIKSDRSPVTVADRQSEEHLRRRIAANFPADGIVGEEFPQAEGTSNFRWILDPIDGTKSFVHGVPLYGTMIAVEHEGRSVLGAVLLPPLDELVYASVGKGAWVVWGHETPQPAKVSACNDLAEALFLTTSVKGFRKYKRERAYEALEAATRLTRTWGDCYGYMLVATGRAEIMIDPVMNVWDAAALQPILEEAGGTFTDWSGEPTIHHGEGVATNGKLLDAVLAITRSG